MTLRTPRRRISPRTKRRYRAIREFFRKALGTSSQQEIKINSSIAINVTDLKHKIVGLEHQLNEVSKHCQDLAYIDSSSRKESGSFDSEPKHDIEQVENRVENHRGKANEIETKVLYKTSESHYRRSDESEYAPKTCNDNVDDISQPRRMKSQNYDNRESKVNKKVISEKRVQDYGPSIPKHRTRSVYENCTSAFSGSSFHSLIDPRTKLYNDSGYSARRMKHSKREFTEPAVYPREREKRHRNVDKRQDLDTIIRNYEDKLNKSRKSKHKSREVDQDFIADIIKKQYRPIKMFGRKESEASQFSAPVCRDQEFTVRENIVEGSELCSCCYDGPKHTKTSRRNDVKDMRSVCDTRLYSSKRRSRSKHHRKQFDVYNDSNLYDLIPVKEKTSPKSRRKFYEDNAIIYNYDREVPPSPRTHRPRLNLQSQYYAEFDNYMAHVRHQNTKQSPHRSKKRQECIVETEESDNSSENLKVRKGKHRNKHKHLNKQDNQQDAATISSLPYPNFVHEPNIIVDTPLNKTQETDSSIDKTDKALCEIKDILQNFLQEIKKDTTASQCDKSEILRKQEDKLTGLQQTSAPINSSVIPPNAGHSLNNFNLPNCNLPPYMPPFPNPCCYPIMPMCPMNCVQSGYIVPSPSFTCATCAHTSKESQNEINHNNNKETRSSETEELIKEIYKYISQSPTPARKRESYKETVPRRETRAPDSKLLTSRSVGGSSKSSKHDAKVGTPRIKCYSKSCEAIGSRLTTNTYSSNTNASYSDTVLERLSLEVTASQSESETSVTAETDKEKKNKFRKVLRSIGLFKKKKKDTIEELSESESTVEVDVKLKPPPFRQEIMNYSMHGQEYFNRPPVPPHKAGYAAPPPEYRNECRHPAYNPKLNEYQMPHDMYYQRQVHEAHVHEQTATRHFHQPNPSAPPFPSYESYSHLQSQVPLCLKEIEVKSTGTQSERRMSIFNKLKKKIQPPPRIVKIEDPQKTCSTQTKAAPYTPVTPANQTKPGLFNWKNLQAKAMEGVQGFNEPMAYSYKTQKQLVDGDKRMRNAMLRKLFYKKNPLSPNNLLVRTIMGKDRSSYGEPPRLGRARMFF